MEFLNNVNMLTTADIISIYIDEFNVSKERKMMMKGERYYRSDNDIKERQITRWENEEPVIDPTKPNNRLAHGFMHNLVDDKVNFLLTKPYTLSCDKEEYLNKVKELLGKRFQKRLSRLGTEASNKGIGWLYVYIDEVGKFKTKMIPSEQCIAIWTDNDHEELEAMIRYYVVEVYEGKLKRYITKIEYYTPEGVSYYVKTDGGQIILDAERYLDASDDETIELGHFTVGDKEESWGQVPFIPFKNNDFELPDLQFVKSLIDNYDKSRSDIANMLEEVKNVIFALRGYGGESLSDFMRDLSYYRAIKLDDDGGLDTVNPNIDINAAKEHYETLKKDIYDFGQGVDKSSDKLGNSPSGIALKFIYSGLDLKCNALEEWFQWGFDKLIEFVNKYLEITGQGKYEETIDIVFNRDIAINESQAITDCQNSKGIISDKTIIENHPWVKDTDTELKQIEEENKSLEDDMFPQNVGDGDGEEE